MLDALARLLPLGRLVQLADPGGLHRLDADVPRRGDRLFTKPVHGASGRLLQQHESVLQHHHAQRV
jgi:hypothetical protein